MATAHNSRLTRAWCFFRSGPRAYAVALEAVTEIIEADGLVRLPLCPPCIRGFCTFRRDVVPVVRLTDGIAADPAGGAGRLVILILRTEHSTWGVEIGRGGAVVAEETMEESGASQQDGTGPVLIGSIHREGVIHAVIDAVPTWRRLRESVERWYGSQHSRALPRRAESSHSSLGASV